MDLFDRVPKLERAVPEPSAPTPIRRGVNVVIEENGEGKYWITRIREDQARSAMLFTRDELVELRLRINVALGVP